MIELKALAVYDLSVRFARVIGPNKVRHYVVPMFIPQDQTPEGLIREHIANVEQNNESIVFKYFPKKEEATAREGSSNQFAPLDVTDVTNEVLDFDPEIEEALSKVKATKFIVEYSWYPTGFHRFVDKVAGLFQKIGYKLGFERQTLGYAIYRSSGVTSGIPNLSKRERRLHLVRFLSIQAEEQELDQAYELLRQDLDTLNFLGLIEGNLAMPSQLEMADTIGLGGKRYAVFCFPIINERKLKTLIPNEDPYYHHTLAEVGVLFESREGEIGKGVDGNSPDSKYEIETVQVFKRDEATLNKMLLDSYLATQDVVGEIQTDLGKRLEELDIAFSSEAKEPGKVEVQLTVSKRQINE